MILKNQQELSELVSEFMADRDPRYANGAAFVAGGSGGIGAAVCLALAKAGSNIQLTYRSNAAAAQAVAHEVRACGVEVDIAALDLCDAQAVASCANSAANKFGRLHSVVYASGPTLHMNPIANLTPEEWARVVNTDVMGAFNLVHGTLPLLKQAGGGAYVAVITAAVERVPARDICSAAPKAAVEMLFRGVAKEEGRNGIRANCVGPGWIEAGLGKAVLASEFTAEQVAKIRAAIPLRRMGSAAEVANAVEFLLSSKASFISGQTLAVDGGMQI